MNDRSTMPALPEGRRLPWLISEGMTNVQQRDVVVALSALACSHLGWLIGADPNVNPSALSTAEIEARVSSSVEAYRELASKLVDAGLSDAYDVVQTLVDNPDVA